MRFFLKAEELYDNRQYEEALINYNESLIIYPYYAEAYFGRAATKEKLQDVEGALNDYNIFIELKPDQFDAIFSRALLLFSQEKWALAQRDFIKLLNLPVGETTSIYFREDRFSAGINQVFTTQGTDKSFLFNYIGLTQLELKEFDKALTNFDSAIYYNQNDADYIVNAGKCYEALHRIEEAKFAYQKALFINPNHNVAQHNLSVINRMAGEDEDAKELLDEIISKDPNLPFPYAERAFHEMKKGEYKRALKDYNEALRLSPDEAHYWLDRGTVKEKLKNWQGAFDDYTMAIQLDEKLERAWLSRANLLYKRGEYQEAIKDYDIAILVFDDYGIAYFNRGLAKHQLGNDAAACLDLKQAQAVGFEVKPNVLNNICGVQ